MLRGIFMRHGFAIIVLACFALSSLADERLKDIACRSVHLHYPAPEGVTFINEITPRTSAEGTYFMVCGWSKGYYGIQESASGKKVLIFSVWDPGAQNDPKAVKDDDRVRLIHKDPDVKIGRFGNEGTGGQSFYDFDWKLNETYRFAVTAKAADEGRTEYTGYFLPPDAKEWKRLVTFSTKSKSLLKGYYSFVEDFRRNKISTTKMRSAEFGNGWMQTPDGAWRELTKAMFTADANPVVNINAKIEGGRFWLGTGGELKNTDTALRAVMARPASTLKTPEGPREVFESR